MAKATAMAINEMTYMNPLNKVCVSSKPNLRY
jgi:hypothetical protein